MLERERNTQYHILVRYLLCLLHFAMRAVCLFSSRSHALQIMTGHSLRYIVTTRNATWLFYMIFT